MDGYSLLELDQMEATRVRRYLHPLSALDEGRIRPLLAELQQKSSPPGFQIVRPRWETNVYPLYYWAHRENGASKAYDFVFKLLSSAGPPQEPATRKRVRRMVNSEIDIIVEDADYFLFIEAKELPTGRTAKFQDGGGVRQLVRQYVQGRILQKLIGKQFWLATIGANNEEAFELKLTPAEQELLRLAGDERTSLKILDLSWKPLAASAQAAG